MRQFSSKSKYLLPFLGLFQNMCYLFLAFFKICVTFSWLVSKYVLPFLGLFQNICYLFLACFKICVTFSWLVYHIIAKYQSCSSYEPSSKSSPVKYAHVKMAKLYGMGSSIQYARKIFRKTNISYPLIRTRTCPYQGVRNVSFSKYFACVLNG